MSRRNSKMDKHESSQLLIRMMKAGFKNNIIEQATLESDAHIRKVRREMESRGELNLYNEDATSGAVRKLARIVDTRNRMSEAAMILSYYITGVSDQTVLDFNALMDAHDLYLETFINTLRGRPENAITVNQAFVLINQYRAQNNSVVLRQCGNPRCRAPYLEIAEQRMRLGCPLCVTGGRPGSEEDDEYSHSHDHDEGDELDRYKPA